MVEEYSNLENKSSLVSRNITVLGKRTSVRLEPEMWRELKNISDREHCSIHDLCSLISLRKNKRTSLTAAIRVFLMLYFRAASTDTGHERAGHGDFENMKRRAGMAADWTALKFARAQQQNLDAQSSADSDIDKRLEAQMKLSNSEKEESRRTGNSARM